MRNEEALGPGRPFGGTAAEAPDAGATDGRATKWSTREFSAVPPAEAADAAAKDTDGDAEGGWEW